MDKALLEQITNREQLLNSIREILIESLLLPLSKEELDPDTPLFATGLGLDSVDAVVIIVELESRYGIAISEAEGMVGLRTINTLVDLVESKLNEKNGSQV